MFIHGSLFVVVWPKYSARLFWHTPAKYMTLGPKFFCFSKMAVTRRRKHLNQQFLAGSLALDVSYLSSLSKQGSKHFSKIELLGFAAIVFPYSYQAYMIYNISINIFEVTVARSSVQNGRRGSGYWPGVTGYWLRDTTLADSGVHFSDSRQHFPESSYRFQCFHDIGAQIQDSGLRALIFSDFGSTFHGFRNRFVS